METHQNKAIRVHNAVFSRPMKQNRQILINKIMMMHYLKYEKQTKIYVDKCFNYFHNNWKSECHTSKYTGHRTIFLWCQNIQTTITKNSQLDIDIEKSHTLLNVKSVSYLHEIIIIIMLHFYRAIFLTSQVNQRHTYTSIRIRKNVKSITKKNKSIGSMIQLK